MFQQAARQIQAHIIMHTISAMTDHWVVSVNNGWHEKLIRFGSKPHWQTLHQSRFTPMQQHHFGENDIITRNGGSCIDIIPAIFNAGHVGATREQVLQPEQICEVLLCSCFRHCCERRRAKIHAQKIVRASSLTPYFAGFGSQAHGKQSQLQKRVKLLDCWHFRQRQKKRVRSWVSTLKLCRQGKLVGVQQRVEFEGKEPISPDVNAPQLP